MLEIEAAEGRDLHMSGISVQLLSVARPAGAAWLENLLRAQ